MKCRVFDIEWDTSEELPTEVTLIIPSTVNILDDEAVTLFIEDELSNQFGFTHKGFGTVTIN